VGWSLVAMLQVQQEDTGLFVGITPAVDFSQQPPGTGENANRVIGRFTEGHARMAAVTRFFSESFEKSDTKPPKIHEFNLAGPAQAGEKTVKLSINMTDDKGLGPLVIMQRGGGQIDAFVKDLDLQGENKYSGILTVEAPRPLVAGQPLIYIMNVFDVNGNLSQSVINSSVVSKQLKNDAP